MGPPLLPGVLHLHLTKSLRAVGAECDSQTARLIQNPCIQKTQGQANNPRRPFPAGLLLLINENKSLLLSKRNAVLVFQPRRVTYASFYTSRELSIVIVEIDTGASADEDLQIVGSRDQGNSSRNHQTPTLLDRQARFLRETPRVEARLRNSRKRGWGTRPVPP